MHGKIVSAIMLFLLVIGMLAFAFRIQLTMSSPATMAVPDDYPTIQAAINAASDGDTVFVRNGTYYENVIVNKTLSLVGESMQNTIIDGGSLVKDVVTITVDNVSLTAFTIQNGGDGSLAKVTLDGASHCSITRNYITNTATHTNWGVRLYDFSNYNSVSLNTIANQTCGIHIEHSSNYNSITGNTVTNNTDHGIYLYSSSYNTMSGNTIAGNKWGVYPENSNNNYFFGNNVTQNSYGAWIRQSSGNRLYHNKFIDNAQQVGFEASVYANVWDDGYPSGGNFWSDYAGVDFYSGPYQNETGSDGIGDTPYIIDVDNVDYYPLMTPWEPMVQDDWPMSHHDLTHTGYSTSTAPETNKTLWSYATGTAVASSPAVAGGVVYVGSFDNNVYALDARTGAFIWNYTTGDLVASSPAVVGGVVYVGSMDGNVYALNGTTGTLVWNYTTGSPVDSSPAVVGGVVYVGSRDHNVYGLNATTGAQVWNYTTGTLIKLSSPAVVGGVVYVGSMDGNVYALNGTTGTLVWNYTTGSPVDSSPAVVGGVVYVGSMDGNVYALDATTGAQVSNYTTGTNWVESSPAVAGDMVYVGSDDGNLYALNATTGAHIWNYTTGNWVFSSPAVAGGVVYVGSFDNNVYALDARTGAFIWSYATGAAVASSPAVVGGVVYVGSLDGNVYAIGRVHDVAVTSVTSSKDGCLPMSTVGQGFSATINVTVANEGGYPETFNAGAFANVTIIGSENITLPAGNSTTVTFTWNTTGFAYGNYTVSAYAWPVQNETNTADNSLAGGTVYVGIPGDINGDGTVDIYDAIMFAGAFNATPGKPNWNPNADIYGDGIVDIYDAIILAGHFNQHYP